MPIGAPVSLPSPKSGAPDKLLWLRLRCRRLLRVGSTGGGKVPRNPMLGRWSEVMDHSCCVRVAKGRVREQAAKEGGGPSHCIQQGRSQSHLVRLCRGL